MQVRFGVPYFDMFDPRFRDFGVPVAVRGTITFQIDNYRHFIKLHRLDEFDLERFRDQVKDAVSRYVKSVVANAPVDLGLPAVQIERGIPQIHERVEPEIKERLLNDFGVSVSGVDISALEIDKTSEGYISLMAVTRDVEMQTVQAQADVNIKNLQDQQRINAENLEETLRIQREESQYAQRKTTQTANFAAYQLEQQAAVGIAGAQALGQMGANGATEMGSGAATGGGGMDPAAMMAGMAIGGALGQNMAGMMNGMMGGLSQPMQQTSPQTPPPVPSQGYYIAVGGSPIGPFANVQLASMADSGALAKESLVWKPGMTQWQHASDVAELRPLFEIVGSGETSASGMPPIPSDS